MRRTVGILLVATAAVAALAGLAPSVAARSRPEDDPVPVPAPPFVTLMFGRSMWAESQECQQLGPDLYTVAALLAQRGIRATGMVVPARTAETGVSCINGNLYPSWEELAQLRDVYGWTFVSNGQRRVNITKLDPPAQRAESCGSLDSFAAHGHYRAWGMFGPGSNHITDAIATSPVGECFAFVRQYSATSVNDRASVVGAPYYVQTNDTSGGVCNLAPCTGAGLSSARYMLPSTLAGWLAAAQPDTWVVLSTYKLVDGAKLTPGRRWDCTDPDPQKHWTSEVESYCLVDLLAALDTMPVGAQVVDPATVAEAYGRLPIIPPPAPPPPPVAPPATDPPAPPATTNA